MGGYGFSREFRESVHLRLPVSPEYEFLESSLHLLSLDLLARALGQVLQLLVLLLEELQSKVYLVYFLVLLGPHDVLPKFNSLLLGFLNLLAHFNPQMNDLVLGPESRQIYLLQL